MAHWGVLPFAGALLVWSADRPLNETFRIPADGLVLGRDLLDEHLRGHRDDRISRSHTRLSVEAAHVRVTDLGSRNGTFSNGHTVAESIVVTPPSILRTGRSVWVIVPDVRRYEHVPLQRRGGLVVAGTLDPLCRELDDIANAEANVLLYGPLSIGRELAASYAGTIGGEVVRFDPETMKVPLERVINQRSLRTLILELGSTMPERDAETLATWLETDIRVATVVRDLRWLNELPSELVARLAMRRIDVPKQRFDELPAQVFEQSCAMSPAAPLHATVIERCLLDSFRVDEDTLQVEVRGALLRWCISGNPALRGEDLDLPESLRHNDCIHADYHLVAPRLAAYRRGAGNLPLDEGE